MEEEIRIDYNNLDKNALELVKDLNKRTTTITIREYDTEGHILKETETVEEIRDNSVPYIPQSPYPIYPIEPYWPYHEWWKEPNPWWKDWTTTGNPPQEMKITWSTKTDNS